MSSKKFMLRIFDVSGYVHAGNSVKAYSYDNYSEGYPVGGIRFLMKALAKAFKENADVICCFDSSIKSRKEKLEGYKAGRPKKHAVYSQLDYLYKHLTECGITCLKKNGVEADELIYNAVEEHKKDYTLICVMSTDYDLLHNVDDNVQFMGATSLVNNINKNTFMKGIYPGIDIAWNSISAYKVFCGDKSDNIKPIILDNGITGKDLYDNFIETITQLLQKKKETDAVEFKEFRNVKLLQYYIKLRSNLFSPENLETINRNIDLVYPKLNTSLDFSKFTNYASIDLNKFLRILYMTRDRASLKTLLGTTFLEELTEQELNELRTLASELRDGSFAVDKSLSFSQPVSNAKSLNIKGF